MEERYLSGYCRRLDAPRMVEVLTQQGKLCEVDCDYEACPFRPSCTIAKEIEALLQN